MTKHRQLDVPEIPMRDDLTIQEHVYERLRYAIMVGAFPPGTNLTMRGLAEAMGLSPTPIREAVRRLSSEHAIEVLQNRRMTVPEMTLGRFEELLALRVALEVHAAERSLPYVSNIIIENMESIDLEMDAALTRNDLDRLTILNQDFHRALYMTNPHQVSMPVIESVWLQMGPFQRQVIENVKDYYKVDRHKEILDALRARDVAALVIATESDIREGMSRSGRQQLTQSHPDGHAA
ncbi:MULTISPECIES: GntR family transcriptional regulator [unclassified Meridianimarinicoccus]|uniref:GntR family transcriptional regulator n=1 Tax=unclassified Meridianimarinicoccus TaxID=2923344 RepID=UPI0018688AF7|nr:GntR family transcriptional regulator [Fluviibacterium sp. MJW13]